MKSIAVLFALCQLIFAAGPAVAESPANYSAGAADHAGPIGNVRTVQTESWVEEWDPATGQWVKVEGASADSPSYEAIPTVTTTFVNGTVVSEARAAARYAQPADVRGAPTMLAQYGPFVVTSATSASMVGSTGSASPAQFDAMLRDFPHLAVLNLVEAPGTSNDIANLAVGRRIREAGIATHVPNGGSVRSGAVELFLAGATRTMERGAQFAVHSWLDNHGREPDDFAADHPAHRLYIDYYVEMGMTEAQARDFYAMTNSVPHSSALWLGAGEMRPWLRDAEPSRIKSARTPAARMAESQTPIWTPAANTNANAPIIAMQEQALPTAQIEWGMVGETPRIPTIHYSDLSVVNLARLDA